MRWPYKPKRKGYGERTKWTKWYAWRPVHCYTLDSSPDCVVWLAYVYRKSYWTATTDWGYWTTEYITPEEYERLHPISR